MLKILYSLACLCTFCDCKLFDYKLITAIRNGIDKNLDYIDQNYEKMNEDCLFGVVLATGIIEDAYLGGTHVTDRSSLKLLKKSFLILQKALSPFERSGKSWVVNYILDPKIWRRHIKYRYNTLSKNPSLKILENIYNYQNLSNGHPNSDFCLEDVVNLTLTLNPVRCYINRDCWRKFYDYKKPASGYILTHKLLLLQLSKARKCLIPNEKYEEKTYKLCSMIFAEVTSIDYFDILDDMFDLFLEEVLLCGYEGYAEFFTTKWIIYILKSQKQTGCFPPFLGDPLKTRIKRNTNILQDGCADHTTGLGLATLSLYYNFIIKENIYLI